MTLPDHYLLSCLINVNMIVIQFSPPLQFILLTRVKAGTVVAVAQEHKQCKRQFTMAPKLASSQDLLLALGLFSDSALLHRYQIQSV